MKTVQHDKNSISKECNIDKLQHKDSDTWNCNMKKMPHENSATSKKYNMKKVQHKKNAT